MVPLSGIELEIKRARSSLGRYCSSICKAKCCKKGVLYLRTKNELKAICNGMDAKLIEDGTVTPKENDMFTFRFDKRVCPSLTYDDKCSIYANRFRPGLCNEFPIFLRGNKIFIASFCPAKEILDSWKERFKEMGYEIVDQ